MNIWAKIVFTIVLCGCFSASAKEVMIDYSSIKNKNLFGISIESDKQEFFGRVLNLQGVSIQKYRTESFAVTELNLEMTGSSQQVRIYSIAPLSSNQVINGQAAYVPKQITDIPNSFEESLKKTPPAQTVQSLIPTEVFKSYPVVTHAKTIEYLLDSEETVYNLYESIKEVWINPITSEEDSGENDSKRISTRKGLNRCLFIIE